MILTVAEMIAKIDKPSVRELVAAYWKVMGPDLEKAENDIIKNMEPFGKPSSIDEENIRGMIRTETLRTILTLIQERITKELERREAEKSS